jgi:hypothetical protein
MPAFPARWLIRTMSGPILSRCRFPRSCRSRSRIWRCTAKCRVPVAAHDPDRDSSPGTASRRQPGGSRGRLAEAGLMMPPRIPGMGQMAGMMGPGGMGMSPMMGGGGSGCHPPWHGARRRYGMRYGVTCTVAHVRLLRRAKGGDMYGSGIVRHGRVWGLGRCPPAGGPVPDGALLRPYAEVGKSYRYRVRVVLEDPNRPFNPQTEPSSRCWTPNVIARLDQIEAQDRKYQELVERTGTPPRASLLDAASLGRTRTAAAHLFRADRLERAQRSLPVRGPYGFVAGPVTPAGSCA